MENLRRSSALWLGCACALLALPAFAFAGASAEPLPSTSRTAHEATSTHVAKITRRAGFGRAATGARSRTTYQLRARRRSARISVFSVDTTPPSGAITSPAPTAIVSGTAVAISVNASDDASGVASVQVQYATAGGSTWTNVGAADTSAPYSATWNTTALTNSDYDLRAVVTDVAANSATTALVRVSTVNAVASVPAYVGTSSTIGSAANVDLARPGSVAAGHLMLAQVTFESGNSITVTPPSGWSLVQRDDNTSNIGQAIYSRFATASEPASYTWTLSSAKKWTGGIVAYSGVHGAVPVDVSGGATGYSSSHVAPSITTTVANTRLVAFYGGKKAARYSTPSGMTERYDLNNSAGGLPTSMAADQTHASAAATGTKSATFTSDDSITESYVAQLLALRPDSHAPASTLDTPAPGAAVRGSASLAATATDPGGIASVLFQYRAIAASSWTDVGPADTSSPYSASWSTSALTDGLYDVRAVAADATGNRTSSAPARITVDNTAPTSSSLTAPAAGANLRGATSLAATATDAIGVAQVSFERSPTGAGNWTVVGVDTVQPYSLEVATSSIPDGVYDLRAVSSDAAGNTLASATRAVRIDNTAPTAGITAPTENAKVGGATQVVASVTETGSGLANVRLEQTPVGENDWTLISEGSTPPFDGMFETSLLADGVFELRAIASDLAGNVTTTASRVVSVDNTLLSPGLSFYDFTNAGMSDGVLYFRPGATGGFTVQAEPDDPSSVAKITFPALGSGWTGGGDVVAVPWSSAYSFGVGAAAADEANVVVTETSGLTSPASSFSLAADSSAPTTTATCGGAACPAGWSTSPLAVRLRAFDSGSGVSQIRYTTDGSEPTLGAGSTHNWPFTVSASTTVRFRAYDGVGNPEATGSVALLVDTSAPSASLAPVGPNVTGTITLDASASDGESGIGAVRFETSAGSSGTTWTEIATDTAAPYSTSFDTRTVADGQHRFRAVALNGAGAQGASSPATVTVDNTPGDGYGFFSVVSPAPKTVAVRGETATIPLDVKAKTTAVVATTLRRAGRQVFRWRSTLKPGSTRLRLRLPKRVAKKGRYVLTLRVTARGRTVVKRYPIRIVKRRA